MNFLRPKFILPLTFVNFGGVFLLFIFHFWTRTLTKTDWRVAGSDWTHQTHAHSHAHSNRKPAGGSHRSFFLFCCAGRVNEPVGIQCVWSKLETLNQFFRLPVQIKQLLNLKWTRFEQEKKTSNSSQLTLAWYIIASTTLIYNRIAYTVQIKTCRFFFILFGLFKTSLLYLVEALRCIFIDDETCKFMFIEESKSLYSNRRSQLSHFLTKKACSVKMCFIELRRSLALLFPEWKGWADRRQTYRRYYETKKKHIYVHTWARTHCLSFPAALHFVDNAKLGLNSWGVHWRPIEIICRFTTDTRAHT